MERVTLENSNLERACLERTPEIEILNC
ncbi:MULTISPECIES: hypothetical protein [Methanosarcina]